MTERVLFVSPHLGDVPLSCPGHLLEARAAGHRTAILTLFSDGDNAALYEARRAEDREAARVLGADAVHAGLLDAPARRGHPPSYRASFLTVLPRDADDVDAVTRAIARQADDMHATRIVGPLGVGQHVDHRLAHEACRALGASAFYEDQPYALPTHAVRYRFDVLGAEPAGPCSAAVAAPVVRAVHRAALSAAAFANAHLPSGPEREAVLDEATLAPAAPRTRVPVFVASQIRLGRGALRAAHLALRAYPSQLAAVLGGTDALPLEVETLWSFGGI
jgi:LmbE family N-acetylglucosaminyl deacetylase